MELWKNLDFDSLGTYIDQVDGRSFGLIPLIKDVLQKDKGCVFEYSKDSYINADSEADEAGEHRKFFESLGGRLIFKVLGSNGQAAETIFLYKDGMVNFSMTGNYVVLRVMSHQESLVEKVRDRFEPLWKVAEKKGHVYAIVQQGPHLSLSSIGNAGIELVSENYTPKVIEDYRYIITDLQSEYPSGRIVVMRGTPGCHRKGQKILMFDGSIKKVEEVIVGDKLMGPDSLSRKVISLCRGNEEMVEIIPVKGEPWVVNKNHILSLVRSGTRHNKKDGTITDISVSDWAKSSKEDKHYNKLFRAPIHFDNNVLLPIDPYILGVLLGDGSLHETTPHVTSIDLEIVSALEVESVKFGLSVHRRQYGNKCPTYSICFDDGGKKRKNPFAAEIRKLGLNITGDNKFIPQTYKLSNDTNRLKLLAGLLDTDGHFGNGVFDYISKSQLLADDVAFISRSLGFAAYVKKCVKASQNGTSGEYYRVCISGNLDRIPTKIKRKIAPERKQIKNVLRTGFSINHLPTEDYYGFTLTGDGRYLLDDFTVTHNTGKTHLIRAMLLEIPDAMFVLISPEMVTSLAGPQLLPLLMSYRGGTTGPIVLLLEDADKCLVARDKDNINSIQSLLNLGDGILGSLLDLRIVATTNANELHMEEAIMRPGRLSKMLEVGRLDVETARGVFKRLCPKKKNLPKELSDANMTLAEVYSLARKNGWKPGNRKVELSTDNDDDMFD